MSELRTHVAILKNHLSVGRSHSRLERSDSSGLITKYTELIDNIKHFIDQSTTFLKDGKVDEVLSNSNTALSKFDADRKTLCDEHIELVKQKGGKSKRLKKRVKLSKKAKLPSKRKRR
jgi:hypothetical protein